MICWLIGMSGSGKTTIAEALYKNLKPTCRHLVFIDGDQFREVFKNDADHTVEGRAKNAARISNLCKALDTQNIHVIAAVLSIFPDWQAWNRENFSSYQEIFLDISLETLKQRDTKGLYSGAEDGSIKNVVGYDIEFPRPSHSDLMLSEADQQQGVVACVGRIKTLIGPLDSAH